MTNNDNNKVEMITDEGDNLVEFDMGAFLNPSAATRHFLQEQATAKLVEMAPAVHRVLSEQQPRPSFDFASMLG